MLTHWEERGFGLWGATLRDDGTLIGFARYVWEQAHGPIPQGMTVDHFLYNRGECVGRACVEVFHLRLVTRAENTRSAPRNAAKAAQTACRYGHPFDEHNTHRAPNGTRKCETDQRRARSWNLLPREAPYVPAGWESRALEFERQAVGALRQLAHARAGLDEPQIREEVASWLVEADLAVRDGDGLLHLSDSGNAITSDQKTSERFRHP